MTAHVVAEHSRSAAHLEELAPGVHAYLQPPGGWCVSNSGVIVGDDLTVVVDSLATEQRTLRLREEVDALASGGRRIVVNTHHHGDHVFGNHLFGPDTTVVAHEEARREMAEAGLVLTGMWPDVPWGDVRVTLPDITFTDRMALDLGSRRVELIHVGPAHTTCDVVVWLPEERVLFAGDVLFSGAAPFVLMGSLSGSFSALETIGRLGPSLIVCGHGEVAGPALIDETVSYLQWVEWMALEGRARGLSPLEMAGRADMDRYGHLTEPERLVGNLHRAYTELGGTAPGAALDVAHVFEEMVSFNGGRLPSCLA
ncbi:MBL fold metallo-hydrolase [Nocardiopsis nanhaiensis]